MKRNKNRRKTYKTPAIIYQGKVGTRAGDSGGGIRKNNAFN